MEKPAVGTLLDTYGVGHFSFVRYYALSFGVLASWIGLELPVERGHLYELVRYVSAHEKTPNLFVFGHSLGSLIVQDYVLHYPAGLNGCILSGIVFEPVGAAKPAPPVSQLAIGAPLYSQVAADGVDAGGVGG